jgi:hypothetical protein
MRYRRSLAALAIAVAVALVAGCVAEPVDWGDVSYRRSQLGDPDTRSSIMSADLPTIAGTAPCSQSVRAAGSGANRFRAWWSARRDSSVVLSLQRSADEGARWQPPVEVDARDRGRRGCARPAPGIFQDSASGYVHLVYFIEGSDGAGVFFAHSMDNGGMFHSPVPVVYGNTPSVASVAGHGDSVVVVFEDPNSNTPRIGIVLSSSTGHIFAQRGQATPDEVPAVKPWVALDHDTVAVWWKTPDAASADDEQVGYRRGVWR